MNAVGTDFQVVVLRVLLPGEAPVGSNATNVNAQEASAVVHSGIWLRSADVRGTIDGSGNIQVVVPHGVPADSRNVFRQSSIDDGASIRP